MATYAWPLLALMWPRVRGGRRIWEFLAGFLIYLPWAIVAAYLIPDLSVASWEGAAIILGSSAGIAVATLGVFHSVPVDP